MGAGKILAIIGAIVGILSVVLYYLLPELFSYWRFDGGAALSVFLGGFGFANGSFMGVPYDPEYADDIFLLLVSILIIAGSALLLIGALVENKPLGIIGGIVCLGGPILLIIALFLELGNFADFAILLSPGDILLFGSMTGADWGLWIGTYMAIGAGAVGIIGGATL
ncbi:MAG: hypothetical protein ACFE91_01215 [Promethearchaeota archaeon]